MGMKPRVNRVCIVCGNKLDAAHNRKTCSDECAHKRRMAKQQRRRNCFYGFYTYSGIKQEWAK